MENNIDEPWASAKVIAEYSGVTNDIIHKWIKTDTIPYCRVGNLWEFKKSELDALIKSGGAI